MTEIIAIIRRDRLARTKEELARCGTTGYTLFPVLGRGLERGLRTPDGQPGPAFLPKILLDVVVDDERAQETVEAIIRANQTGQFGDGRIFLIDVGESYRISTGAREPAPDVAEVTA
jgi:nitrogen regulatory protein PII